MNPVCIPCEKEYICDKNGVLVRAGHSHYYVGDRWKCPSCKHLLVSGYGDTPIHNEPLNKDLIVADLVKGQG